MLGKSFVIQTFPTGRIRLHHLIPNGKHFSPKRSFAFVLWPKDADKEKPKISQPWSWGENSEGQLGQGNFVDMKEPKPIAHFEGGDVQYMACGLSHSAAITSDGVPWVWGANDRWQIGMLGKKNNFENPRVVERTTGVPTKQLACGYWHTLLLNERGELYALGDSSHGQLGLGDKISRSDPHRVEIGKSRIKAVSAGALHSAALSEEGELWVWGKGYSSKPEKLENFSDLTQLACGVFHTACATKEGAIFTIARGNLGGRLQKPTGPEDFTSDPTDEISRNFLSENIVSLSCGLNNCAAVGVSGKLYVWTCEKKPQEVQHLRDLIIDRVSVSATHCAVVTNAGELFFWKPSVNGDLLVGNFDSMEKMLTGHHVNNVALGWNFGIVTCLVDKPKGPIRTPLIF